jgi:5-methylcytosine-specific restriction endonuclease McrBC GTP-binding regulatory subunit McrB
MRNVWTIAACSFIIAFGLTCVLMYRIFKLENGVFFRFCKRAQSDPENKYFFIIDEISSFFDL